MAAAPPSKVEKKGRIANATSTRANVSSHYPLRVVLDGKAGGNALVQAEQPWGDAQLAGLYDAFVFGADLPMYLELARAQGRRVLEVASGSGRVLVPLVRAGFDVVGIDVSPHMLALARAKLAEVDGAVGQAELIQADMRDFRVASALMGGGFDLAILAVKSFAYLTERADQLRTLSNVADHLRPGGLLAIDLMHVQPDWIGAADGAMRADLVQQVPDRGSVLSRVESVVTTDLARQVRVIRSVYELVDDRGVVIAKRFVEWPYRWTHRFEAEHLLERAGFAIEALYGGYQREPFTSSCATMMFVARKLG
jgi:SAM-dependent methyltransferase